MFAEKTKTMKKISYLFAFLCFSLNLKAQGYIEVKEEPFRGADMIVILNDSLPSSTFDMCINTLIKYDLIPKYIFKEYGTIITDYNSSRVLQWSCQISILQGEIRIQGKYNSNMPMGQQMIIGALAGKDAAQTQGVVLDYRDHLKDYFNQMTEIANIVKSKTNSTRLVFIQRPETIKYE